MAIAELKFESKGWEDLLVKFKTQLGNPAPFLLRLGQTQGFSDIQQHFSEERGPEGSWAPWSPAYARKRMGGIEERARKRRTSEGRIIRKAGGKILQDTGDMRNSLLPGSGSARIIDRQTVMLFSNKKYSRTHDVGDPKRNIPARPFMWISEKQKSLMAKSVVAWVTGSPGAI